MLRLRILTTLVVPLLRLRVVLWLRSRRWFRRLRLGHGRGRLCDRLLLGLGLRLCRGYGHRFFNQA
jgi:hypothetical protein